MGQRRRRRQYAIKYYVNIITALARLVSVDPHIVTGDEKAFGCILDLIFTRTARRQDAVFAVLAVLGSYQVVNQPFISVCVPRDDPVSHQTLVGSHATGMRVSTESTGVVGVW